MDTNLKKILLVFGGGVLLFWAFKKIKPIDVKTKTAKKGVEVSADGNSEDKQKNAKVVLKAFMEAKKAGESKDFLAEMNREFAKEYGLKVLPNKSNGKMFVSDLEGNKVI